MTTNKKRHRYTKPPQEERKGIRLYANPRYLRVLYHLWKHRYCTVAHLAALLSIDEEQGILVRNDKRRKAETGNINIKGLQQNLNKLWQNGYIHRRFVSLKNSLMQGSEPDVYFLADKGAEIIAEKEGLFIDQVHYPELPRKAKSHNGAPTGEYDFLRHNLAITDVLVGFQVFAHLSGKFKVIYCTYDKKVKETFTKVFPSSEQTFFIRPDGILILENEEGKRANFFLEIDRKTEKLGYWQKKIKSYYFFHEDKLHIPYFEKLYHEEDLLHDGEELQEGWLKNFRVLTVTLSKARMKNMVKSTYPLFHDGKGSTLFWYSILDHFLLSGREKVESSKGTTYTRMTIEREKSLEIGEDIWTIGNSSNPYPVALFPK